MKETLRVVKLLFQSPLHIHKNKGDYDTSEEMLHSDTISSAMAAKGYSLYDSFDGKDFMNHITVSSAFPFYGDQYFFPKPMIRLPVTIEEFSADESSAESKKLKKIQFIEQGLFEEIINGKEDIVLSEDMIQAEGKYLSREPVKKFIKTQTQQRVTIPSEGGDARPYYVERIYFDQRKKKSGLYFLIDAKPEYFQKAIELLSFLGEEGIGTDRAVGNGQFEIELDDIQLQMADSSYRLNLSLYWPEQDEIEAGILENSSYDLIKRGGFLAGYYLNEFRHLRKNSVFMFTEGSVFRADQLIGKVGNLRPEWNDPRLENVYRSGRSFSIPVHVKEE